MSTFSLLLAGVLVMALGMWALGWIRRSSIVSVPYLVLTSAIIWWVVAYIWEVEASGLRSMMWAAKLQYLAVPVVPVSVLVFALRFTGRAEWLTRRAALALFTIPALTAGLALTNDLHGLIWQGAEIISGDGWSLLGVSYGPFFWVFAIFSYGTIFVAATLIIEGGLRTSALGRRHTVLLIIGLLAPWVANFLRISGLAPYQPLDLTPFAFGITSLTFGFGALNFRLLALVPVARDRILDLSSDGVVVVDPDGRIADLNSRGAELLRLDVDKALGAIAAQVLGPFAPALEAPHGETVSVQVQVADVRLVYECSRVPIDRSGRRILGDVLVFHDVTKIVLALEELREARDALEQRILDRTKDLLEANDRLGEEMARRERAQEQERALEVQLREVRYMESVGRLAGGIAHDFNNLLQAIIGHAELCLMLDIEEGAQSHVRNISQAADRGAALVQQILTYSRRMEGERTPVLVSEVVGELRDLIAPILPKGCEMLVEIDRNCLPVYGDATQLHQLVMNLARNALEAMSESGGRLRISLDPVSSPQVTSIKGLTCLSGDCLRISVADTGPGMSGEVLEHVFEPFFTTKRAKGSGLGLAVVHGIVEHHDGAIEVHSVEGKGTRFDVYLPVWRGTEGHGAEAMPTEAVATF